VNEMRRYRSQARPRAAQRGMPGFLVLTLGYALGLGHAALAVYIVVGGW